MGTSLLVNPVASIPQWVGKQIPRLLINRELVGDFAVANEAEGGTTTSSSSGSRDVYYQGDCDDGVLRLCQLAGSNWENNLQQLHQRTKR